MVLFTLADLSVVPAASRNFIMAVFNPSMPEESEASIKGTYFYHLSTNIF